MGTSKQILQGCIPQVWLSCDRAIYQGLHLRQIELQGSNIAVNLPEVVKQKPLRLLEPVFVELQLQLDAEDLQASLNSPLLQSGLNDLWQMIIAAQTDLELAQLKVEWQQVYLAEGLLHLMGSYRDESDRTGQLAIAMTISLVNAHALGIRPIQVRGLVDDQPMEEIKLDLGSDVAIKQLEIGTTAIECQGQLKINN